MQLGSKGEILNDGMFRANSSAEYIARSSKVITMVDLAGHERYVLPLLQTRIWQRAARRNNSLALGGAQPGPLSCPPKNL